MFMFITCFAAQFCLLLTLTSTGLVVKRTLKLKPEALVWGSNAHSLPVCYSGPQWFQKVFFKLSNPFKRKKNGARGPNY